MHVDILTDNRRVYTYESYAAKQVKRQFHQMGISCRHLSLSDGNFFQTVCAQVPDAILCFERVGGFDKPIGDFFHCPTFHWESNILGNAGLALESKYAKVGFFDPSVQHPNVVFLPHAASLELNCQQERPFDCITFTDVIDLDNQIQTWELLFGKADALAIVNEGLACPASFSIGDLLFLRDRYQKAKIEWDMVHSIFSPLHIFGEHVGRGLLRRFPQTVTLHGNLSYMGALSILSKSKILLSHQMSGGFDRWFLPALFCGSLVITNETPYLQEMVGDQFEIFYPSQNWEAMEERACYFLEHPEKREEIVKALQEKLEPKHNWGVRTSQLINYLR